ncbi:hypothetical protein GGR56DRAFT_224219 [Xylariaceae sp. FL0804]|nr:hypothetical protein GGR56DRAFT_224219 [Xylariaceae sp. FL0804]
MSSSLDTHRRLSRCSLFRHATDAEITSSSNPRPSWYSSLSRQECVVGFCLPTSYRCLPDRSHGMSHGALFLPEASSSSSSLTSRGKVTTGRIGIPGGDTQATFIHRAARGRGGTAHDRHKWKEVVLWDLSHATPSLHHPILSHSHQRGGSLPGRCVTGPQVASRRLLLTRTAGGIYLSTYLLIYLPIYPSIYQSGLTRGHGSGARETP